MTSEIDASNIVNEARRPVQVQQLVGDSPTPSDNVADPVSGDNQNLQEAPVSEELPEPPFLAVPEVFMDPSNDNDEDPDNDPISPISSHDSIPGVEPDISLYQLVGAMERISMLDMARYAQTHPQLFNSSGWALNPECCYLKLP